MSHHLERFNPISARECEMLDAERHAAYRDGFEAGKQYAKNRQMMAEALEKFLDDHAELMAALAR